MSLSPLLLLSLALAEGSVSATNSGGDGSDLKLDDPVGGGDADHDDLILGFSSASLKGGSAFMAFYYLIRVLEG